MPDKQHSKLVSGYRTNRRCEIIISPIKRFYQAAQSWNNFFRSRTKFSKKIVPGIKFFTENFVPPNQNFPEQNSSDRTMAVIGSKKWHRWQTTNYSCACCNHGRRTIIMPAGISRKSKACLPPSVTFPSVFVNSLWHIKFCL